MTRNVEYWVDEMRQIVKIKRNPIWSPSFEKTSTYYYGTLEGVSVWKETLRHDYSTPGSGTRPIDSFRLAEEINLLE